MWVRCIAPAGYPKVILYQNNLGNQPYFNISYQYMGKTKQHLGKVPRQQNSSREATNCSKQISDRTAEATAAALVVFGRP
jgi:hypothetical protein